MLPGSTTTHAKRMYKASQGGGMTAGMLCAPQMRLSEEISARRLVL